MPQKESDVSFIARKYISIPKKERNSRKARALVSELGILIKSELSGLAGKKGALVYHLSELEDLRDNGKVGEEEYDRVHDSIQERIHEMEATRRRLVKGLEDPRLLVEGATAICVNRIQIIVFVEILLVLTVLYLYYSLTRGMPP